MARQVRQLIALAEQSLGWDSGESRGPRSQTASDVTTMRVPGRRLMPGTSDEIVSFLAVLLIPGQD